MHELAQQKLFRSVAVNKAEFNNVKLLALSPAGYPDGNVADGFPKGVGLIVNSCNKTKYP